MNPANVELGGERCASPFAEYAAGGPFAGGGLEKPATASLLEGLPRREVSENRDSILEDLPPGGLSEPATASTPGGAFLSLVAYSDVEVEGVS